MIADLLSSSSRILVLSSIAALCSCDAESASPTPAEEPAAKSQGETVDDDTYPLELPDWYEKLWMKLDAPVDIAIPEVSLAEALGTLEALMQVPIRADESAKAATSTRVEMARVVGLPLERVLNLLVIQVPNQPRMEFRPTPEGIVVTREPNNYPQPEAAPICKKLKRLRDTRAKTESKSGKPSVSESIRRIENRLQATRLTATFTDEPITEVIKYLRDVVRINVGIDPELDARAITVSITTKDEPANEVLDRILETTGLGRIHRGQILFILDKDKEKDHRLEKGKRMLRRRERLRKIEALLQKKLEPSFEGKTTREASAVLREALGVPVHLGPEAWRSKARIVDLSSPTDLLEIGQILESRGLRMIVEEDAVYVVAIGG